MPNQKTPFITNQIYHVYNRGVEKRKIFMNNQDYFRCIHDLFEFNDTHAAIPSNARFRISNPKKLPAGHLQQLLEVPLPKVAAPRTLLVNILAFCLMPNHVHLLLQQREEGGITQFMRKLGTGYTNYFNIKYDRVGSLFQGIFKAEIVDHDTHFLFLPFYIHTNPLALFDPTWQKKGLEDIDAAITFLESYRWSSYLDYIGKKNFPSVSQRDPLLTLLNNPSPTQIQKELRLWLSDFMVKSKERMLSAETREVALDLDK